MPPEFFAVLLTLNLLWSIALTIYSMSRRPGDQAAKAAADAAAAVVALAARVQALESDVRHLPTADDVHRLGQEVAGARATLASMQDSMRTLTNTVALIDQYLRTRTQ
jgi:uncharacterized coiled-coil protein SlyX